MAIEALYKSFQFNFSAEQKTEDTESQSKIFLERYLVPCAWLP